MPKQKVARKKATKKKPAKPARLPAPVAPIPNELELEDEFESSEVPEPLDLFPPDSEEPNDGDDDEGGGSLW